MIEICEEHILDALHCGNPDMTSAEHVTIYSDIDDQRSMICDPLVEQLYAQMIGWA